MTNTNQRYDKRQGSGLILYNGYMDDVKPWDLLNPNAPRSVEELHQSRLAICRGCEFFKPRLEKCSKCGCFMKLKTKLENARCPIGKW